jgi:hypothetical protein
MIVQVNNRGKAVHNRINWKIYLMENILSGFYRFFIKI